MKINGSIITADEGKVLMRLADSLVCGTELNLGFTYYIGGKKLDVPHMEVPSDYIDATELKFDDNESIYVTDLNYSALKAAIVKLKYNYDNQIAIILNHQASPDNEVYTTKYNDMQDWREKACVIAKQYAKGGVNE